VNKRGIFVAEFFLIQRLIHRFRQIPDWRIQIWILASNATGWLLSAWNRKHQLVTFHIETRVRDR
jgi:pentose-5-phosphate-3-epimerase